MKKTTLYICILLSLTGCMKSETEKLRDKMEKQAVEAVKEHLKDADSAKFRNQYGMCGEVNAKNSFGAYTGYKKFMAIPGTVVMEDDDSSGMFQSEWEKNCVNPLK